MPALYLPTWPGPRRAVPRLISSRHDLSPATGSGPDLRTGGMGSRYSFDFEMPGVTPEESLEWGDLDDEEATVIMEIPQPDIDVGAPGAPVVNGGGQAGRTLNLRGLRPYYAFRKTQWISVITGGQRFVYRTRSAAIASDAGTVALPLRTLLRIPPADNDEVEVSDPKVEGYPTIADDAWAIDANDRLVHLSFSIRERE